MACGWRQCASDITGNANRPRGRRGQEDTNLHNSIQRFGGEIVQCSAFLWIFSRFLRMVEPSGRYQQLPSEEEAEAGPQFCVSLPHTACAQHRERLDTFDDVSRALEDEDFVARDDFEDADQLRIGNDGIFMLTFFMAFLFNWIGFFLSFCLTTSAAGRYGAISGFGLSLIKWILIVRFSTYFPGYFDGQYWLWWVFLVLGFLLFLRGFINYAKIRKMADSFSALPRTRVLFIY
ncbi:hypothetical protein PDJAM_G00059800 [Pangasius djambal]|uniref:Uncharacterized protein n=1 Tax=Pangasius djambal TaxID=1691987 RepID=A0ACC5YYV3_9TELE|nr:hypothetical protein [Pangasius djambal]